MSAERRVEQVESQLLKLLSSPAQDSFSNTPLDPRDAIFYVDSYGIALKLFAVLNLHPTPPFGYLCLSLLDEWQCDRMARRLPFRIIHQTQ